MRRKAADERRVAPRKRFVTSSTSGWHAADPFVRKTVWELPRVKRAGPEAAVRQLKRDDGKVEFDQSLLNKICTSKDVREQQLAFLKINTTSRFVGNERPFPHDEPKLASSVRFLNESRYFPIPSSSSGAPDQVNSFVSVHQEHRAHLHGLKKDLQLLRGVFSETILAGKAQRLFDQIMRRTHYLEVLWGTHFTYLDKVCDQLAEECKATQTRLAREHAEKARVLALQHKLQLEKERDEAVEMEDDKHGKLLLKKRQERSNDDSEEARWKRAKQRGHFATVVCDESISDFPVDNSMGTFVLGDSGCPAEPERGPERRGMKNAGANSSGQLESVEFQMDSVQVQEPSKAVLMPSKDLSDLVNSFDENGMLHFFSKLGNEALELSAQALIHILPGAARIQFVQEMIGKGRLVDLVIGDPQGLREVISDLSIADRTHLFAFVLEQLDVAGRVNWPDASKRSFDRALRRAMGETVGLEDAEGNPPHASIRFDASGELHFRGHLEMVDASTSTAGLSTLKNAAMDKEAFMTSLKTFVQESCHPTASAVPVEVILNGFENLHEDCELRIDVVPRKMAKKPLFHYKKHPWDKILLKKKKGKRSRELSLETLEETIIGDIYAKKALLDQDFRQTGKRTLLCRATMDYFTQKYGLKKIANEYTYALVQSIRKFHKQSLRVRNFGILCGVVQKELYTSSIGDVTIEFIRRLFGKHDQIAVAFSKDVCYVPVAETLHAAHQIFKIEESSTIAAENQAVGASPKQKKSRKRQAKSIKRVWTMPEGLRHLLMLRLEEIAKPASEIPEIRNEGNILYVHLDQAIEAQVRLYLEKLQIDREMLMHLFKAYDLDGNGVLSLDEFEQLIAACQPNQPLDDDMVLNLWNLVNDADEDDDDDSITKEGFASVLVSQELQLNYWHLREAAEFLKNLLSKVDYFNHKVKFAKLESAAAADMEESLETTESKKRV